MIKDIDKLKYDVAVIDIELPYVNGRTLTQKLKSRYPERPVIVISCYNIPKGFKDANYSMSKPIIPEYLFGIIKDQLRSE